MSRILPRIAIGIAILEIGGYLAMNTDGYIEENAMTGAIRTKVRYSHVFNSSGKVIPT